MTSIFDQTDPHYRAALRAHAREREELPSLPDGLYVKRSRLRRKAANRLMAHAGMVRPARRFRIAPTLGPRR